MKLVREHIILEKFKEESDPIKDLGIGVITIKFLIRISDTEGHRIFIINGIHDLGHLEEFLKKHNIEMYIPTPEDGSIKDVYMTYTGTRKDIAELLRVHYHHNPEKIADRLGESINEKFIEDSDPIHDLGIGIYAKQDFKSEKEFLDFLVLVIPLILKTNEIPEDFIKDGVVNLKYFKKIDDYLEKYISCKNISMRCVMCDIFPWNGLISDFLEKEKNR